MKKLNDYFYKLLKKDSRVSYSIIEDKYYITDGYVVGIFEKDDILFNLEKCKVVNSKCFDFSTLEYEIQQIKHTILEDGVLYSELTDGTFLYDKYLNLFSEYLIMSAGNTSPVKLVSGEFVKGYIIPFKKY